MFPYKIERPMTGDGTSKIRLHEGSDLSNRYAIKTIKKEGLDRKKLHVEIDILMKLKNCQNIVHIQDYFSKGKYYYIILDYYDGGDLETYISDREEMISAEQQIFMAYQIILGIKGIHDHNIIYRNLEPRNIVITTDAERAKIESLALCDFGFSKVLLQGDSTNTKFELYKSPEQLSAGVKYDNSVDIWSYGLILYYIMFNGNPFERPGFTVKKYMNGQELPRDSSKIVSKELFKLMLNCLDPIPAKRPKAEELIKVPLFKRFNQ